MRNLSEKQHEFVQPNFEMVSFDLRGIREIGVTHLWISGGEPTINKDILKILRLTRKLGFKEVIIFTNGRALSDKKFLNEMIKEGVDGFHVALQSHNSKIHDSLTRRHGSFNETIQGIKNIIEEKNRLKRISIAHVMNSENIHYLPDFAQFVVDLKIDCQIAYPFFTSPSQHTFLPRYSDLKEYLHNAAKILLREKLNISIESVPPCFLIGFERYYADYIADRKKGLVPVIKENGFLSRGEVFEKVYTRKCLICDYLPVCAGIYIEYLLNFSDSEIKPVKRKDTIQ